MAKSWLFASLATGYWPLTTSYELRPALARHSHRLRTALLGRQYQRAVRAALLLRGVRLASAIPARSSEFSNPADRNAHRILRWAGMVPPGLRRRARRQDGISQGARAGVPDPV